MTKEPSDDRCWGSSRARISTTTKGTLTVKILGLSALASRLVSFAPLMARVIPGVLMVVHGWQKLSMGPANVGQGMLASLGVPLPVFMGYVVTLAEFLGGMLLIVGLL